MTDRQATLDFLATRRSHPPRMLTGPGPSTDEIRQMLTLAARVPDHGKLEPWRFIILTRSALDRLKPELRAAAEAAGDDAAGIEKTASAFDSPVIVAVVHRPVESAKIPEWEQFLSAGAVCLGLLNAALASGWGASWLTGRPADPVFGRAHLGLDEAERVVGLIHIGTRTNPPPERPRPDIDALTTVLS